MLSLNRHALMDESQAGALIYSSINCHDAVKTDTYATEHATSLVSEASGAGDSLSQSKQQRPHALPLICEHWLTIKNDIY
jgi:hypothetical protein